MVKFACHVALAGLLGHDDTQVAQIAITLGGNRSSHPISHEQAGRGLGERIQTFLRDAASPNATSAGEYPLVRNILINDD